MEPKCQKIGGGGRIEETRRTARILDIIQHIAVAPNRWTRKAMAAKYEVSERQIQKDFEIIRNRLNLDLRHGEDGYFLKSMPKLPTVSYSFSEALSLLLAARTARIFPGVDSVELTSAIARLESLFPSEALPLLNEAVKRMPDLASSDRLTGTLNVLSRAFAEKRQVRITYRTASRADARSVRTVDPYSIVPYMRVWQLVAYCHNRNEIVEFNIGRIEKAELLDSLYEVPADFTLEDFFSGIWGVYRSRENPVEDIVLEFEQDSARWMAEWLWRKDQSIGHPGNGRVRLDLHISVSPDFISWLMSFGRHVKVIKPAGLRDELAAEHGKAASL